MSTPSKTYGSGNPSWNNKNQGAGHLNSRYQSPSYQNNMGTSGGSYQPPKAGGGGTTYAEQQTGVVEDSLRTQYQAEATANTVMAQMTTQRYQLQGARDNVADMRQTTEKAKKELADLASKAAKKRRRLQMIIAFLAATDTLLFFRLAYCGGSFFCR